eukprot:151057-Amphidinium_carterae.1
MNRQASGLRMISSTEFCNRAQRAFSEAHANDTYTPAIDDMPNAMETHPHICCKENAKLMHTGPYHSSMLVFSQMHSFSLARHEWPWKVHGRGTTLRRTGLLKTGSDDEWPDRSTTSSSIMQTRRFELGVSRQT